MANTLINIAEKLATEPVQQLEVMQEDEAKEEAFNDIKAEVDKLGALDGNSPNWEDVKSRSIHYLQHVDTDLRIACYLARAWSIQQGFEGLQAGLALIDSLLRNKADVVAPTRNLGRQHALDSWGKHSQRQWQSEISANTTTEDREQFIASLKALCELVDSDEKIAGQPELLNDFLTQTDTGSAASNATPNTTSDTNTDTPIDDTKEKSVNKKTNPDTHETLLPDAELEQFLNTILSPISDNNPVGDDDYESDEFETIKKQINQISGVAEIDWDAVLQQCSEFLSSKSKDLRVMAYCVYAQMVCSEVPGLHRGLSGLQAFLQTFGADCHPARATGRRAALEWLAKRIHTRFQQRSDARFELMDLKACSALCENINEMLVSNEQIMVPHASLGKAARVLRDLIESAEANHSMPAVATVDPPATPPKQSASQARSVSETNETPTANGDIEDDEQFRNVMKAGNTYVLKLVRFKRNADMANPMSYRLLRTWLWGGLSDTINTSQLQAPAAATTPDWQALIDAQKPQRLLESAEKMLSANRFFLDLNRYSAIALEELGYHEASMAIQDELRQFIKRFPHLPMNEFANGDPVADEVTKNWLQTQVLASDSELIKNPQELIRGVDSEETDAQELLKKARALAKSGDKHQAVQSIEKLLRSATCERDKFIWRLRLARFFMDISEGEIALATVEGMESDIEEFRLERWDPACTLDVANLSRQIAAKLESNDKLKQRAQALMVSARSRICRLEPAVAIEQLAQRRI